MERAYAQIESEPGSLVRFIALTQPLLSMKYVARKADTYSSNSVMLKG